MHSHRRPTCFLPVFTAPVDPNALPETFTLAENSASPPLIGACHERRSTYLVGLERPFLLLLLHHGKFLAMRKQAPFSKFGSQDGCRELAGHKDRPSRLQFDCTQTSHESSGRS